MDKGIRSGVGHKFNELLPQWKAMGGKLPGSNFRHAVVAWTVENYEISWASACTAYNTALIDARKTSPELTLGLGRPEGKKGGRKKKSTQVAQAVTLLLGYTPTATAFEPVQFIDEQYEAALMAVAGSIPNVDVVDQVPNGSDAAVEVEKTYTVTRAKDGVVIVSGITLAAAEELVSKAAAQKKAKLVFA